MPDPSKEKTPGSLFLGSESWLLLQRSIFSALRRKVAGPWCLRGLIIYHIAQPLDYKYSCFFPVWASAFICVYCSWQWLKSFCVELLGVLKGCHWFCFIPNQKWEPRGSFQLQTWIHAIKTFTILFSLYLCCLFVCLFVTDPKDNISYKHLVPWIGMYSQGFVWEEWFWR